jgi:hypothetical protein
MEDIRLVAYERRIAERGLKVDRFDGSTLFLTYDAADDTVLRGRQAFEVADIRVFAMERSTPTLDHRSFPASRALKSRVSPNEKNRRHLCGTCFLKGYSPGEVDMTNISFYSG